METTYLLYSDKFGIECCVLSYGHAQQVVRRLMKLAAYRDAMFYISWMKVDKTDDGLKVVQSGYSELVYF